MFARLIRLFQSLFTAGTVAAPLKAITGIVISIIIPYLLYAFLGGFGLALAIVGIVWGVWYLARKGNN